MDDKEISKKNDNNLFLELGDIIQINAPKNSEIHDKVFFISYLNETIIELIEETNDKNHTLNVTNNKLDDESILSIIILDKSEKKGFALQNDLIPGKNITIEFGGFVPMIVNGTIINLEDDMIEIKEYLTNRLFYINFDYKGIPKNLPIISFKPFDIPNDNKRLLKESDIRESPLDLEALEEEYDDDDVKIQIQEDLYNKKEGQKEILLDADNIVFETETVDIVEVKDVGKKYRRYDITIQLDDLLTDMMVNIPATQKNPRKIQEIHHMIERFKQLRKQFSIFDTKGNAIKPLYKGKNNKPLINILEQNKINIPWLIPICKNNKNTFETLDTNEDIDDNNKSIIENIDQVNSVADQYKNNVIPDGQNKYKFLIQQTLKEFDSFNLHQPDPNSNDIIIQKKVNVEMDVILENINSLHRYIRGTTHLIKDNTNYKYSKREELIENDRITLLGYYLLPAKYIQILNIFSTNMSLLKKVLLNTKFFYKHHLIMNTEENTKVIDVNEKIQNYFNDNKLTKLIFNSKLQYDDRNHNKILNKFLNHIIPDTLDLIKLLSPSRVNPYSINKLIELLEAYHIYEFDITKKEYQFICDFMEQKHNELIKHFISTNKNYKKYIKDVELLNKNNQEAYEPVLKSFLKQSNKLNNIFKKDFYNVANINNNSEMLNNLLMLDGGALYLSSMKLLQDDLMQSIDLDKVVDENIKNIDKMVEEMTAVGKEDCQSYTLSKKYIAHDELIMDDDSEIYFDKKYDTTRYGIFDDFRQLKETVNRDELIDILKKHLVDVVGLKNVNLTREAEALIDGRRKIIEDDYAILDDDGKIIYYIRKNNKWRIDDTLSGKAIDEVSFCNLKNKCLNINNECNTNEINKNKLKKQLMEEIVSNFEHQFHYSNAELKKVNQKEYKYNLANIKKIIEVKKNNKLKYDIFKINLGNKLTKREIKKSPYAKIRDFILSEPDLALKSNYIIEFVNKYCYVGGGFSLTETIETSDYWYYCNETDLVLLPTFFVDLANCFINKQNYLQKLNQICASRGVLSDDGGYIIDKYSGYIIRNIDYDDAEGYNKSGFKIIHHEVLEKDGVDEMLGKEWLDEEDKIAMEYENVDAQYINNIIQALNYNLHIKNINKQFIVKHGLILLKQNLISKKQFNKKIEKAKAKGKKINTTYDKYHDEYLLFITLGLYILTVQTSVPGVKTNVSFPNCNQSLKGYPLYSNDLSFINYISCVVYHISKNIRPWNIIVKNVDKKKIITLKQSISNKIKTFLDNLILPLESCINLIKEKKKYLKHEQKKDIAIERFNLTKWDTFLPPLVEFSVEGLTNISPNLHDSLLSDLRNKNISQHEKLNSIYGKIRDHSFYIIEMIETIVNGEEFLLITNNGEMITQNACCNMAKLTTFDYFVNKNKNIEKYNKIVKSLSSIRHEISNYSKSNTIFINKNTKIQYPNVQNTYNKENIYKSFFKYCKFNSGVKLNETLMRICKTNKSKFLKNDTIESKVQTLKDEGVTYTEKDLILLLEEISKKNMIYINYNTEYEGLNKRFSHLIGRLINVETKKLLNDDLLKLSDTNLWKYDSTTKKNTKDNLYLFLDNSVEQLQQNIYKYMRDLGKETKVKEFLNNFINWDFIGEDIYMTKEDNTGYKVGSYIKNVIVLIVKILPNIIKNQINIDDKKPVPKHWKLSDVHVRDVITILKDSKNLFKKFYGDENLMEVLFSMQDDGEHLILLLDNFIFNPELKLDDEIVFGNIDGDLYKKLMFYFLLTIFDYLYSFTNISYSDMSQLQIRKNQNLKRIINSFIDTIITMMNNEKRLLNMSKTNILEKVSRSRDKEKENIKTRLGELTIEQRKVENLKKKHRIGDWNLGQKKALFEYDRDQYDKERYAIEHEALLEQRLMGQMDDVSEMNMDIFRANYQESEEIQQRVDREIYNLNHIAEDGDGGEDEYDLDYGDI
jgi:hypothetical protein|uniref:Uncharacterized protein n=1 Tax=viral metagenome TaxID=1070528 RepID=A0A6C0AKK7_9ZZZZ